MLFDKDLWEEVMITLKSQKWRSILTMFGIFWGIFMLVVLVGCGFGVKKGVMGNLLSLASNSVVYMPQMTSMPYGGLGADRTWTFRERDRDAIAARMGKRAAYITKANQDFAQPIVNGENNGFYTVLGVSPTFIRDIPQEVLFGRYINDADVLEHRKVCVVGRRVVEHLFDTPNPCGQWISVGGGMFLIVGVVNQSNENISIGEFMHDCVLIPLTCEQDLFNRQDEIQMLSVGLYDNYDIDEAIAEINEIICRNHSIHPDDKAAMKIISLKDAISVYEITMVGVEILILIVGLGTLIAGLIGISNIMLVTIKERTHEIGVRRALGAQPGTIIMQIMLEALVLTIVAGLLGIVCGAWLLGLLNEIFSSGEEGSFSLLVRPMIPPVYALGALLVLSIGGVVAGYIPAKKALKIKAIEALNASI